MVSKKRVEVSIRTLYENSLSEEDNSSSIPIVVDNLPSIPRIIIE